MCLFLFAGESGLYLLENIPDFLLELGVRVTVQRDAADDRSSLHDPEARLSGSLKLDVVAGLGLGLGVTHGISPFR